MAHHAPNPYALLDPDGGKGGIMKKRRGGNPIERILFDPTPAEAANPTAQCGSDYKYLLIKPIDNAKTLLMVGHFPTYKTLQGISNEVLSLRMLQDGSGLILVKNSKAANKITEKLTSILSLKVKVEMHPTLNSSKGIIYLPEISYMSDEEIKEMFHYQNPCISEAQKMYRTNPEGKRVPNGCLKVTFGTMVPPKDIFFMYSKVEVRLFYPAPLRCRRCQQFRHHEEKCQNTPRCRDCGQPRNPNDVSHVCEGIFCPGCGISNHHTAYDRACPKFMEEKAIVKIMVEGRLSKFQARKKYYEDLRRTNTPTPVKVVRNHVEVSEILKTAKRNIPSVQTFAQVIREAQNCIVEAPSNQEIIQIEIPKKTNPNTNTANINNKPPQSQTTLSKSKIQNSNNSNNININTPTTATMPNTVTINTQHTTMEDTKPRNPTKISKDNTHTGYIYNETPNKLNINKKKSFQEKDIVENSKRQRPSPGIEAAIPQSVGEMQVDIPEEDPLANAMIISQDIDLSSEEKSMLASQSTGSGSSSVGDVNRLLGSPTSQLHTTTPHVLPLEEVPAPGTEQ